MVYLFFGLPLVIAFLVLWFIDDAVEQRARNSFIAGLVEVAIVLVILGMGLGLAFYLLS
jgi:hypothetical protein